MIYPSNTYSLNYLFHVLELPPDSLPNWLANQVINKKIFWCKDWQKLGWKHAIKVAWVLQEIGIRMREQLIAKWNAVRGESRTDVKRAAENALFH